MTFDFFARTCDTSEAKSDVKRRAKIEMKIEARVMDRRDGLEWTETETETETETKTETETETERERTLAPYHRWDNL